MCIIQICHLQLSVRVALTWPLCVEMRNGTGSSTEQYIPLLLSLCCCQWHFEMERKASSKMRCEHVYSMNSCFAIELLKDERAFFCQLSQCILSKLQRHTFPPFFHFCFFFLYYLFPSIDLLDFIPGRSQQHLSKGWLKVSMEEMGLL